MVRDRAGGIAGLLTLPREQWEAIEYDLLDKGFVLADVPHRVSWRAVLVMVRRGDHGSAFARQVDPVATAWSATDYLAAIQVDLLQTLVWMKTKDGHKGRRRPKPLPRPGSAPEIDRVGNAEMTLDETDAFLRARRARATCSQPDCSNPAGPSGPCPDHEVG